MDFDPAQAAQAEQLAARRQQMLSGALAYPGQPRTVAFYSKPMDAGGAAPVQATPNVTAPGTAAIPEMGKVTQLKKKGTWANGQAQPDYTGLDAAGGPAYG